MGTPRKARLKRYDIDKAMKAFLAIEDNRTAYERDCRRYERQTKKPILGWKRRILMEMMFPEPERPSLPQAEEVRTEVVQVREVLRSYRKSSRALLNQLVEAQGGLCYLCNDPFGDSMDRLWAASVDHVVPQSKGGKDHRNVLAAHKACNGVKSNRDPHLHELEILSVINAKLPMPVESVPNLAKVAAFKAAMEEARLKRLSMSY